MAWREQRKKKWLSKIANAVCRLESVRRADLVDTGKRRGEEEETEAAV
jgi:hypothetical protein